MCLIETDRSVELSNLGDVVQMKFPECHMCVQTQRGAVCVCECVCV